MCWNWRKRLLVKINDVDEELYKELMFGSMQRCVGPEHLKNEPDLGGMRSPGLPIPQSVCPGPLSHDPPLDHDLFHDHWNPLFLCLCHLSVDQGSISDFANQNQVPSQKCSDSSRGCCSGHSIHCSDHSNHCSDHSNHCSDCSNGVTANSRIPSHRNSMNQKSADLTIDSDRTPLPKRALPVPMIVAVWCHSREGSSRGCQAPRTTWAPVQGMH